MKFAEQTLQTNISEEAFDNLKRTKPWVLLVAISGITVIGLSFLSGLFTLIAKSFIEGLITISLNGILLIPFIFLLNYGNHIGNLLKTEDSYHFDEAINNQRKYWQWIGVFTIVFIALLIVLIFAVIAIGDSFFDAIMDYPVS